MVVGLAPLHGQGLGIAEGRVHEVKGYVRYRSHASSPACLLLETLCPASSFLFDKASPAYQYYDARVRELQRTAGKAWRHRCRVLRLPCVRCDAHHDCCTASETVMAPVC